MEACIGRANTTAATDMWLLIDEQVNQRGGPNFPRRMSTRVEGAHELVAHENYIVYIDQIVAQCTVILRAELPVARQFPPAGQPQQQRLDYAGLELLNPWDAVVR